MSRLTWDGTAEPVSRGQTLRRERGQGNIKIPCSADHVQNWQPYPVDPYSCYMCDYTYIPASLRCSHLCMLECTTSALPGYLTSLNSPALDVLLVNFERVVTPSRYV